MTSRIQGSYLLNGSRWARISSLSATLVILLFGWWQASHWYETRLLETKHVDMQRSLITYGNTLTTEINHRLAQLEGLAAFAQTNPTRNALDENFPVYAAGLYTGKTDIRAIQIFPSVGPMYIYPTSSNEVVLGRTLDDLINDERPEVWVDVHRALDTRQITLSGPYELRQGGLGLVSRLAVYQEDTLWGMAVIILDIPPLLSTAGISTPPAGIEVALRDSGGQIIAGRNSSFASDPELYTINLPEGTWTLGIIPTGGWQQAIRESLTIFRLFSLAIVGLVFSFVVLTMSRQTQLARDVKERTAALAESLERQQMLVEQSPYAIGLHQDGVLIFANPAAAQLLGAAHPDELIGKPIIDIIHPDTRASAQDRIKRLFQGEKGLYPVEDRYVRLDGSVVPVEVTVAPFTFRGQPAVQVIALDISERKHAEESLRETTEQLQLSVRAANVGLWDWNLVTNRVYYSPEWKRQLGHTEHDIDDDFSEWSRRVHPADLDYANSTIQAFLKNPWPNYQIEFRMRHKDGSYRWILSQAALVRDDNNQPVRMRGAHIDITERKQAEQSLQESEEKLRLFIEHAPAALAMFDDQMRYIAVSRRWLTDYGLDTQNLIGRSHYEVFPEIPERWKAIHRRGLAGEVIKADDDIFVRADGSTQWLRWEVRPWYTGEDCVGGIVVFSEDITIRRQAEEKLHRYSEHLTILHKIDRGIVTARTPEDILTAILPHIGQAFAAKHTSLNLFNKDLTEVTFIAGETKRTTSSPVRSTHKIVDSERLARLKTGEILFAPDYDHLHTRPPVTEMLYQEGVRSTLTVPLLIEGQLIGAFSVHSEFPHHFNENHQVLARDISFQLAIALRQAQMMTEIEAYAEELEQRVNERTAQLEAKTRELETFNYSVSHDLKAPLRGIDGYSRLLLEDYFEQLDVEGQTFLNNIRFATNQMSHLIDDLLVYSRLERSHISQIQLDLNQVVQSVISEYAEEIKTCGATVSSSVPPLMVTTDPSGISIALRNLLDNALKFTNETTKPVIEIGGHETETSCILWVRDNGIGFDMKYHGRIFEIFQRLHRVEDYEGTGVGLAIVRKAMERAAGRVWAESNPGQGATFYLELPRL